MADRVLYIGWGEPIPGREEWSLEVFNEAVGILGRKQQEGAVESFDVVLFAPNGEMGGYMAVKGSAEQIAALKEDADFQRNTTDAQMVVRNVKHLDGFANEGVAQQMELYQGAIGRVPQPA